MIKKNIVAIFSFAIIGLIVFGYNFVQAAKCDPAKLAALGAYQNGDAVSNLQSCLIESGFSIPAGATGYYGSQTIDAVKSFYASWYGAWNGLKFGPLGVSNLKKNLSGGGAIVVGATNKFKTFAAASDFKNYFDKAIQESNNYDRQIFLGGITATTDAGLARTEAQKNVMAPSASANASINRVSETNVQVAGIDEPDIVKTDGREIYYSPSNPISWWGRGIVPMVSDIAVEGKTTRAYQLPEAKVIKALPPSDMAIDASIKESGDLLLSQNILAVFSDDEVNGYDISNPKNPRETLRSSVRGFIMAEYIWWPKPLLALPIFAQSGRF
jgi:peptidoglycan hydrolase-like protein with peptidoglycan-binding domain